MSSIIKLSSIKSFSSESSKFPAENLLNDDETLSWKCNKWVDYSWITLELSKESTIDTVTVKNDNSAFIEIFVSDSLDSKFKVLVPVFSSQSPSNSKNKKNGDKEFIFTSKQLTSARDNPCKFIKCICSQPYNNEIEFGLSSIKIHGNECKPKKKDISKYSLERKTSDKQKIKQEEKKINKKAESISNKDSIESSNVKIKKAKQKLQGANKEKQLSEISSSKKLKSEIKTKIDNDEVEKSFDKPFEQLMSDVHFVLSGYENPLRNEIKTKAMAMGAKYETQWKSNCTHLICANKNSSKYKEVCRLNGIICSAEWILKSHSEKTRLPWINFKLDSSTKSNNKSTHKSNEQHRKKNNDGGNNKFVDCGDDKSKIGSSVGDSNNKNKQKNKNNNNDNEKNNENVKNNSIMHHDPNDSDIIYDLDTEEE